MWGRAGLLWDSQGPLFVPVWDTPLHNVLAFQESKVRTHRHGVNIAENIRTRANQDPPQLSPDLQPGCFWTKRVAKIHQSYNSNDWQQDKKAIAVEGRLKQSHWKTVWQFRLKKDGVLSYDPAIMLLGLCLDELKIHVHTSCSGFIHNS